MEEQRLEHSLKLEERKRLSVTGVAEVVSFDENQVVLSTNLGTLVIHGEDLQLKSLTAGGGQAEVVGLLTAFIYEAPKQPAGGFLRRLFT